jgi:intracellular sulfur oxidation DsrE/DsrF family protein
VPCFAAEPARILIHLDSSRSEQMDAALDLAEAYLAKAGGARVEVIANHRGLDLLRADITPHAARIAGLKSHHAHVGFVACGQTIARLQGGGVEVALVPEAAIARTAIEHRRGSRAAGLDLPEDLKGQGPIGAAFGRFGDAAQPGLTVLAS